MESKKTMIEVRIRNLSNGRSEHEAQHIRRIVTRALNKKRV